MEPHVIIIIIICVTLALIILAFMAKIIKVELEPTEGKKIPRLKFTFQKDPSLFNFLGKTKKEISLGGKQKKEALTDYITTMFFGTTQIKYGESAETIADHEIIIKSLKDDIDKYYYYNADSGAKLECISGFLNPHIGFKKLRDFKSWDGTRGSGDPTGTHKIALPITRMKKDEEKKLKYRIRLKIHYLELVDGENRVTHGYYFRMNTDTKGAVLKYKIPNGKISDIYKFKLSILKDNEVLAEREIKKTDYSQFTLEKGFGQGWIKKSEKITNIYWNIPARLERGFICELLWFTERKRDS